MIFFRNCDIYVQISESTFIYFLGEGRGGRCNGNKVGNMGGGGREGGYMGGGGEGEGKGGRCKGNKVGNRSGGGGGEGRKGNRLQTWREVGGDARRSIQASEQSTHDICEPFGVTQVGKT